MQPNSSHTKSPQNASTKPSTHNINAAPTLPTPCVIDDGVENIPVPMIRPTLPSNCQSTPRRGGPPKRRLRVGGFPHMSRVVDTTPRCRPRPPWADSSSDSCPGCNGCSALSAPSKRLSCTSDFPGEYGALGEPTASSPPASVTGAALSFLPPSHVFTLFPTVDHAIV